MNDTKRMQSTWKHAAVTALCLLGLLAALTGCGAGTEQSGRESAAVDSVPSAADMAASDVEDSAAAQASQAETDQTAQGSQQEAGAAAAEELTLEDAIQIALEDAGIAESDAGFAKAVRKNDDGVPVYDLEFFAGDMEYDYKIRVADGAIHSKEMESYDGTAGVSADGEIDEAAAKRIALEHAGLKEADVTFTKTELEQDDGQTVYDIEFQKNGTPYEYEYEIHAETGEIVKFDTDGN